MYSLGMSVICFRCVGLNGSAYISPVGWRYQSLWALMGKRMTMNRMLSASKITPRMKKRMERKVDDSIRVTIKWNKMGRGRRNI